MKSQRIEEVKSIPTVSVIDVPGLPEREIGTSSDFDRTDIDPSFCSNDCGISAGKTFHGWK